MYYFKSNRRAVEIYPLSIYPGFIPLDLPMEQVTSHCAKYGKDQQFNTGDPYVSDGLKRDLIQWTRNLITSGKIPADLIDFEFKAFSKWVGPQGGTPSREQLMDGLSRYYQETPKVLRPQVSWRTYATIKSQLTSVKYASLNSRELWNTYSPDKRTNSGVTGWADRRNLSVRTRAIAEAMRNPLSIDPVVSGTRYQRNKVRNIFMDSFANQFRSNRLFRPLHSLLAHSDLVAWRGDRYVEKHVYDFLQDHPSVLFFESDYEAMDTWCDKDFLLWVWRNLRVVFDISEKDYLDGYILLVNMASSDLITPEGVLRAFHSLFSGLGITNDFETWGNLFINLEWIYSLDENLVYGVDFIIIILGDDVLIIFDANKLPQHLHENLPHSFAAFAWNLYGLKAEPTKQRSSYTSGYFCKRRFARDGKRIQYPEFTQQIPGSIYPLSLVLNTILYPEDTTPSSKSQKLIRIWQVCDNAHCHPLWKAFVRRIFDVYTDLHDLNPSEEDVTIVNSGRKNWRVTLYGEKFSIANSPSAQLWNKWCQNK